MLIKHDQVFLTDFGTSLAWSEIGSSTAATALSTTPRYYAPEVIAQIECNTLSDIWSLGCVFLEMWTVLRQYQVENLRTHMATHGAKTTEYHSNLEGVTGWVEIMGNVPGPACDARPATWITNMLQLKPTLRWPIHILEDHILETSHDDSVQYAFCSLGCLESDDDLSGDTDSLGAIDEGYDSDSIKQSQQLDAEATISDFIVDMPCFQGTVEGTNQILGRIATHRLTSQTHYVSVPDQRKSTIKPPRPFVEDEELSLARKTHIISTVPVADGDTSDGEKSGVSIFLDAASQLASDSKQPVRKHRVASNSDRGYSASELIGKNTVPSTPISKAHESTSTKDPIPGRVSEDRYVNIDTLPYIEGSRWMREGAQHTIRSGHAARQHKAGLTEPLSDDASEETGDVSDQDYDSALENGESIPYAKPTHNY